MNTENINGFAQYLHDLGKKPATVASYVRDIQSFIAFYEQNPKCALIHVDTINEYRTFLLKNREHDNSIRRHLIGIRQFIRYLKYENILANEDETAEKIIIPPRKEEKQYYLSNSQIQTLLDCARSQAPSLKAIRDQALIALLAFEGLKASEIIDIEWADLLLTQESSLQIRGVKARVIRLGSFTTKILKSYQKEMSKIRGDLNIKKMFIAFKGNESRLVIPRLTRHGLKFMLAELALKLSWNKLNTELLRHFAIKYKIENGYTIEQTMQHMGLRRLGNIAKFINRNENHAQL